ncbi:MAG: apolipoprotein N-acyltransferase [Deltaproteobacteria bacterium]|nr:MAG: apolipoprotein N-acyltransferase [Deltaproteobacteria bacterium]
MLALRRRGWGMRLGLGAVTGIVWSLGLVGFWLYPAVEEHLATGPLAAAALTIAAAWTYGGAYLAAFALVYGWLPSPRWLAAPAVWVLLEQVRIRALGGAPWGLLGHTQHGFLPLAQLAELTGVEGLSFLVLMPAAALAERGTMRRTGLAVAAVLAVSASGFGALRLRAFPPGQAPGATPRVAVISGHNLAGDPLAAYLEATASAPASALTVWPEAAVPTYLAEDPVARERVARAARARGWLLVGAPRHSGRGDAQRYFNSALLFDPEGRLVAAYDKQRLVPFAERSPLLALGIVARPFSPGTTDAPLATDRLRVGPLICWEAVFPDLARRYARQGVDVLVNLTSDRDLGAGAEQQLAFSRFRTIETRRWLVRASGTGPTLLVDPAGRIRRDETLRLPSGVSAGTTFYVRYGETMTWLAATLLGVLFLRRTTNDSAPSGANAASRSNSIAS